MLLKGDVLETKKQKKVQALNSQNVIIKASLTPCESTECLELDFFYLFVSKSPDKSPVSHVNAVLCVCCPLLLTPPQLKEVRREVELSRRRSLKLKAQVEHLQQQNDPNWTQQKQQVGHD